MLRSRPDSLLVTLLDILGAVSSVRVLHLRFSHLQVHRTGS